MAELGSSYFEYRKHKTDFKTEVIAGVTTFLTMAYIMFLNPIILADGGFDFGGVFTATILSIAVARIVAVYTAPKSKNPLSVPANSPDKINGLRNIM